MIKKKKKNLRKPSTTGRQRFGRRGHDSPEAWWNLDKAMARLDCSANAEQQSTNGTPTFNMLQQRRQRANNRRDRQTKLPVRAAAPGRESPHVPSPPPRRRCNTPRTSELLLYVRTMTIVRSQGYVVYLRTVRWIDR